MMFCAQLSVLLSVTYEECNYCLTSQLQMVVLCIFITSVCVRVSVYLYGYADISNFR